MSATPAIYAPSSLKRHRRTKADIGELHDAIEAAVEAAAPMTLRQLFYALVVEREILSAFARNKRRGRRS